MKDNIEKKLRDIPEELSEEEIADLSEIDLENAIDNKAKERILAKTLEKTGVRSEIKKSRRNGFRAFGKIAAFAACFALVVVGTAILFSGRSEKSEGYLLTIDVNPSIELKLTESRKVEKLSFVNEDAENVLSDIDFEGEKVEDALKTVILKYIDGNYFDEKGAILLSFEEKLDKDAGYKRLILNTVESVFFENEKNPSILVGKFENNSKIAELAEKNNVSKGKAAIALELENSGISVSGSDFFIKSIAELTEDFTLELESVSQFVGLGYAKQVVAQDLYPCDDLYCTSAELVEAETGFCYSIYVTTDTDMQYLVDCRTGLIVNKRVDPSPVYNEPEKTTEESAIRIALDYLGITRKVEPEVVLNNDTDSPFYVVTWKNKGFGFCVHVGVDSGDVIYYEKEEIKEVIVEEPYEYIGIEMAKTIVLDDIGAVNAEEVFFGGIEEHTEAGIKTPSYVISVKIGDLKMEYTILAIDGSIISKTVLYPEIETVITKREAEDKVIGCFENEEKVTVVRSHLVNSRTIYYEVVVNVYENDYTFHVRADDGTIIYNDMPTF